MGASEENNLNPEITTIKVGVKKLKEVTIYPLSMADQFKMTELIQDVMSKASVLQETAASAEGPVGDAVLVQGIVALIQANISQFIKYVTDENAISLEELTNTQFSDLVLAIYAANYETAIKNFSDLFVKVKTVLASKRSLPESVEVTGDTD